MKKEMKIGKEGYEVPSLTIVRLEATNAIMASPIDMVRPGGGVFINHQKDGEILSNDGGWDDESLSSFSSGNSRGF